MQLLRSNVSPETRPEIFKALVCIAYLVSLRCLECKLFDNSLLAIISQFYVSQTLHSLQPLHIRKAGYTHRQKAVTVPPCMAVEHKHLSVLCINCALPTHVNVHLAD